MTTTAGTGSSVGKWVSKGCLWVVLNAVWVGLMFVGAYYGRVSWDLVQSGQQTMGVVTGYEENHSREGGLTYSPIIAYTAADQSHTFVSSNSSYPPAYEIGEEVPLLYNPQDPTLARVDSWWELWLLPTMLGGAAVILALSANLLLLRRSS